MINPIFFYDLFCGAGGLSHAFVDSGLQLLGGLDFDESAIETFNQNFDGRGLLGDIENEQVRDHVIQFLKACPAIKGLIGGAPCQAYSLSGNRDILEKRAYYFEYYFQILKETQPEFFVFENVKGIKSMEIISPDYINKNTMEIENQELKEALLNLRKFKDLKRFGSQRELSKEESNEFSRLSNIGADNFKEIIKKFSIPLVDQLKKRGIESGYNVQSMILNAKDFGSGQSRERFFLVGIRNDLGSSYSFPEPTNDPKTVKEILGDLEQYEHLREEMSEGDLQTFLESKGIFNHVFTRHSLDMVKKLSELPQGANLYKNYSDAWWRLKEDAVSRCVKENHNGCHVHYKFNRVTTPRELARLQGFADSFKFIGTKSAILKMIGNAVDKNLGMAIAGSIKNLFQEMEKHGGNCY